MARLVQLQPIDPGATQGSRTPIGPAIASGFASSLTLGTREESSRREEVYGGWQDVFERQLQGYLELPTDLGRSVAEQGFQPDEETLGQLMQWAQSTAVENSILITPEMDPAAVMARREEVYNRDAAVVDREQEVLSRASPFARTVGNIVGGLGAELFDPINIATLPLGAPARVGFLATVAIEAGINALIETVDTPNRNAIAEGLGQDGSPWYENAALGALFGGGFVVGARAVGATGRAVGATGRAAGRVGLRGIERLGRTVPSREAIRELTNIMSGQGEGALIAGQVRRDIEDEQAANGNGDGEGVREHLERAQEGAQAAQEGRAPDMPDRPIIARPRPSIMRGDVQEVNPRDLLVQPEVFQFRRRDVVAEGGVTNTLLGVQTWRPERAGSITVYEYADGSLAVADGHQRTALAMRIMAQTGEEITIPARVYRETDGFTTDDVFAEAAAANVAQSGRGLTAEMAIDAARALRVRPDLLTDMPTGPGIKRTQAFNALSDDAFAMLINNVIPERFAELIGSMVENKAMHVPMMRLLNNTKPDTIPQAESILSQALQAPVSREVTNDLFGEQEVLESLYIERAKVLEKAMQIMRGDRNIFRTLDERAERIQGTGANRLDTATNRQTRKNMEQALAAVQKLAHRAGPISEALNDGAKKYKQTGRLQDAAQSVTDAVRREIERNGLAGAGEGTNGGAGQALPASRATPDPLEGFSDPVNGEGAKAQIEATRIQPTAVAPDPRAELSPEMQEVLDLLERGATPDEIEANPAVAQAIADVEARATQETRSQPGYGTAKWDAERVYSINGVRVVGTENALPLFAERAMSFAGEQGPENGRIATILLGPPASGKSSIAESIAITKRAAILDSDEIKITLPEYEGGIGAAAVHEESGDLAALLEEALRVSGVNVIVPKVGGSPGSIRNLADRFREAGYTVELVNMRVDPQEAYRRMIARFIETGRLVSTEYVRGIGDRPSNTFMELKKEGIADGYAEIDNNGPRDATKPVSEIEGRNPLTNTVYDLDGGGGQRGEAVAVPQENGGQTSGRPEQPLTVNVERTSAGDQSLFDGIEPITERTRLDQRMAEPLGRGGGAADDSQIGGMFDTNDPSRFDLFDAVPVARGFDENGNEIAVVKSRADLAAEMDADDDAVAILDICVKG
jgi:hypothetical protein